MPRKRKRGQQSAKELEIKHRTKRLMQITFKTDEYIYNHKIIPLREAQQYLRELAVYRKSNLDPRTYQVVEKLEHILRDIIQDEYENSPFSQENKKDNDTITNPSSKFLKPIPNPPVQMLCIPNKVYKAHMITKNCNLTELDKPSESVIELCEDDDNIDPLEIRNFSVNDFEIETAIANLNIQDLNIEPLNSKEFDRFSQSILLDFDDNTHETMIEKQTQIQENPENTSSDVVMHEQEKTPFKKRILQRYTPESTQGFIQTDVVNVNDNCNNDHDCSKASNKPPEFHHSYMIRPVVHKLEVNPIQNKIPKVANTQQDIGTNPNNKNVVCMKKKNTTKQRQRKPSKEVDASKIKQTKTLKANILKKQVTKNKTTSKKVVTKTQNQTTFPVEDLSWVENIKFVRVIEEDEYIASERYNEEFWKNLDYPPDWDNMHFSEI